jgi:hypothetical protein
MPEIPPSPPFSKGGLGGISEASRHNKFSLPNLKTLHVSSPDEHRCVLCASVAESLYILNIDVVAPVAR